MFGKNIINFYFSEWRLQEQWEVFQGEYGNPMF
jgi:hypothetical protein